MQRIASLFTTPLTEKDLQLARRLPSHLRQVSGQFRPLHPPSLLVKPYFPPRDHSLLQRTPNPHSRHRALQRNRHIAAIKTTRSKLIRLRHKSVLKPPIIILRNLPPNPLLPMNLHQILRRTHIHSQLPLRANNLRSIFLPRSHHPARIEIRNLPVPELNNANRVVAVVVFPQIGRYGRDSGRSN